MQKITLISMVSLFFNLIKLWIQVHMDIMNSCTLHENLRNINVKRDERESRWVPPPHVRLAAGTHG